MRNLMSFPAKREVVQWVAPRYHEATAKEKEAMLTEFVAITGYARTYAIVFLNHPPGTGEAMHRVRAPHDGPEVQAALVVAWNTANRICGLDSVSWFIRIFRAQPYGKDEPSGSEEKICRFCGTLCEIRY